MEVLTGIFQDIDDYAVERKHETEWETETAETPKGFRYEKCEKSIQKYRF